MRVFISRNYQLYSNFRRKSIRNDKIFSGFQNLELKIEKLKVGQAIKKNYIHNINSLDQIQVADFTLSPYQRNFNIRKLESVRLQNKVNEKVQIPWYPLQFKDLNQIGKTLYEIPDQGKMDDIHFTDEKYNLRRQQINKVAIQYEIGQNIPIIDYTDEQNQLWRKIFKKIRLHHNCHMNEVYKQQIQKIQKLTTIKDRIPQLYDLSEYLQNLTNFIIKPVQGMVSQRQFLNALAFKVFLCTQYIRHAQNPDYSPEPDVVHQILGHIPTFSNNKIAQLSHQIGLCSLGVSDEQIKRLGAIYLHIIEFGVCKQNGQLKAFGAGIASSVNQMLHFTSDQAKFKKFEPKHDAYLPYKVQHVQQMYCVSESFEQGIQQVNKYLQNVQKPFKATYNPILKKIQCS